jgi:hypothetical protein
MKTQTMGTQSAPIVVKELHLTKSSLSKANRHMLLLSQDLSVINHHKANHSR